MQNFVRKWRELAPFIFRATATAPFFFTLVPPRRASPFSVRASGAQALKVAQVLSTPKWLHITLVEICENGLTEQYVYWHYVN